MDKAKSLKVDMENCKQDGEVIHKKLDNYKEECKKEITAFRRDINKILDKIEKDTHPDLKLGKTITLKEKCRGLQVVNDEIYTTCRKDYRCVHDEVWRLDRAGNVMSKIVLPDYRSGHSYYLGLCLAAGSSPCVYLTNWNESGMTCFQLDGKEVYEYGDNELKRPRGIYVDSAGNSLICGTNSCNVVVITADVGKHGELLTSKDIRWPRCIDYRSEDNTLIVGCENSKLLVCKLEK